MELSIQDQILDRDVCISLCANTLGKGMNPSLHSTTMGRWYDRLLSQCNTRLFFKSGVQLVLNLHTAHGEEVG